MKKKLSSNSLVLIILSTITIISLFLFRYTDFVLFIILFYGYLTVQGIIFFVFALTNIKKNKKLAFIFGIFFLLSTIIYFKAENIIYYINTRHVISTYLKEHEAYKGAKIVGLANKNIRIHGEQYTINYIHNIKMPDNKVIQGYYYQDTSGPFGGPSSVKTNYLYYYKDELVAEYNQKYNRHINIDFEFSNQYVIENIIYTMGSREEILDFVNFVNYKNPSLEYQILIKSTEQGSYGYYHSSNIHENLR